MTSKTWSRVGVPALLLAAAFAGLAIVLSARLKAPGDANAARPPAGTIKSVALPGGPGTSASCASERS